AGAVTTAEPLEWLTTPCRWEEAGALAMTAVRAGRLAARCGRAAVVCGLRAGGAWTGVSARSGTPGRFPVTVSGPWRTAAVWVPAVPTAKARAKAATGRIPVRATRRTVGETVRSAPTALSFCRSRLALRARAATPLATPSFGGALRERRGARGPLARAAGAG